MKLKKLIGMTTAAMIGVIGVSSCAMADGTHTSKNAYSDPVKIAVCLYSESDNTAMQLLMGLDSVFESYDNVTYQVFASQGNADTQVAQLEDTVIQGFDAVLVQATDSQAIVSACQEVMDAGIPLLSLNLAPSVGHAVNVAPNGPLGGKLLAQEAIEATGKDSGKWLFIGPPESGMNLTSEPFYSFQQYMQSVSDQWEMLELQNGDYSTEMGQSIMADMLTKYDDVDFVFAACDEMAEGAAMAAQAAGRDEILIYGAGGCSEKMLEYIDEGLCDGSILMNFVDGGKLAAKFALYAINSNLDMNAQDEVRTVFYDAQIITKDETEEARDLLRSWGVME